MTFDAPTLTLPIHPRTGLQAVGLRKDGRPIWPILGGDGTGEGSPGPSSGGGTTYQPPATQADLDHIIESRLARERARYADYDELKAKAKQHDDLQRELASDKDKAVAEASDKAKAETRAKYAPQLVRAEFKAAAKNVLTDEQLTALLEDLDLMKYVDDKDQVDVEKVTKKVQAFAPSGDDGAGTKPPVRTLGQGKHDPAKPSQRDLGRAEAEKRFGKKS